jgi:hypothetical protein
LRKQKNACKKQRDHQNTDPNGISLCNACIKEYAPKCRVVELPFMRITRVSYRRFDPHPKRFGAAGDQSEIREWGRFCGNLPQFPSLGISIAFEKQKNKQPDKQTSPCQKSIAMFIV